MHGLHAGCPFEQVAHLQEKQTKRGEAVGMVGVERKGGVRRRRRRRTLMMAGTMVQQ